MTTPRHGDRPWECGHIDHTQFDIELRDSRTKKLLGKPWGTILSDANTRRFLAVVVSFDPPSYRSCMAVLRECVRRHGRLPKTIIVDWGKEFGSVYFETFLARYEIHKKSRPEAEPRFGSVCERLFGSTNTRFVHNIMGSTKIMKNVRKVTKSVNPKKHALWTLPKFYVRLREWAYEVHDTIEHPALGQTPREAYIQGMKRSGERLHKMIAYDESFIMLTLPTTPKGEATVIPQRGVKIHYIHYWSQSFRDRTVEGTKVPVRYDPFNAGVAYAYVKRRWVQCVSESPALNGRSEKEMQAATEILRQKNRLHNQQFAVTARQIADFIVSTEAEEALELQRLRDAEYKQTIATHEELETKQVDMNNSTMNASSKTENEAPAPKLASKPRRPGSMEDF